MISKDGKFIGKNIDIVFLGDLIGTGQYSVRVLNLVSWLKQNAVLHQSRVHLVTGNHEMKVIQGNVRALSLSDAEALSNRKVKLKDAIRQDPKYQKLFKDSRAILNLVTPSGQEHWYVHGSINERLREHSPAEINRMVYDWIEYFLNGGKRPPSSTSWVLKSKGPMENRTLHNKKLSPDVVKSWFIKGALPSSINMGHTPTRSQMIESWKFGEININALDTSISQYKSRYKSNIVFRIRENGEATDYEIKRPKSDYATRKCQILKEALGID